jgi:23S rRNA G2069 N7-methylase RlmK/C1962 C5-methylase RlmI
VAACSHRTVQADCFEWLAGAAKSNYDMVILDPPCLAKRQVRRLPCVARETGLLYSCSMVPKYLADQCGSLRG